MTLPIWQWILILLGVIISGWSLGWVLGHLMAKRKLK